MVSNKTPYNLLLAGILLTVTSCASQPKPSSPPEIDIPNQWSQTTSETALIGWLETFDDPRLTTLIETAFSHNPSLQIAAARLDQAAAESRITRADQLPTADLGLNAARQKISTFGPQTTGGVRFDNYDLSLNLSWELDLWGRLRNLNAASIAEFQASEAELSGARLSLAAQVTKAWFNHLAAKTQVALATTTAENFQNNLDSLEASFQRGLSQGLELRIQRRQTAQAQAELKQAQRQLDQTSKSLNRIVGRYPTETLPNATEGLPALPDSIPAGIPADLLSRRPDLIAAERRLAASEKSLTATRKDWLPRISLTASGGTSSQEFDNLLNGDFSVWSLAGNLTQPIFQAGRIRANVDRNASLRDQAVGNYIDTALLAFYEVETTLAAESFLRQETTALATAAEEANEAEVLAARRYQNGTTEFIDYLNIQREAASIRSQLTATQLLQLQNRVDLYLALGGSILSQP